MDEYFSRVGFWPIGWTDWMQLAWRTVRIVGGQLVASGLKMVWPRVDRLVGTRTAFPSSSWEILLQLVWFNLFPVTFLLQWLYWGEGQV